MMNSMSTSSKTNIEHPPKRTSTPGKNSDSLGELSYFQVGKLHATIAWYGGSTGGGNWSGSNTLLIHLCCNPPVPLQDIIAGEGGPDSGNLLFIDEHHLFQALGNEPPRPIANNFPISTEDSFRKYTGGWATQIKQSHFVTRPHNCLFFLPVMT